MITDDMSRTFTAADREGAATLFDDVVRYREQHPDVSFWLAFGHVPRPSETAGELAALAVHALLPGTTTDDALREYLGKVSLALRSGWTPDPSRNTWTPPAAAVQN